MRQFDQQPELDRNSACAKRVELEAHRPWSSVRVLLLRLTAQSAHQTSRSYSGSGRSNFRILLSASESFLKTCQARKAHYFDRRARCYRSLMVTHLSPSSQKIRFWRWSEFAGQARRCSEEARVLCCHGAIFLPHDMTREGSWPVFLLSRGIRVVSQRVVTSPVTTITERV